jgi:hypothetical protein
MNLIFLIIALLELVVADVISDYVSAPDENYSWYKVRQFRTLWGSTAHVLNVTS